MCSKIITEVRLNNLLANFYFLASTYLMAYYTVLSFGVEVALHDRKMVGDGRKQQLTPGGKHASTTEENDVLLSSFLLKNDKPTHAFILPLNSLFFFSFHCDAFFEEATRASEEWEYPLYWSKGLDHLMLPFQIRLLDDLDQLFISGTSKALCLLHNLLSLDYRWLAATHIFKESYLVSFSFSTYLRAHGQLIHNKMDSKF